MKYFSIDYRSPPSGMGQIIDNTQYKMIGNKWNMILVDYGDNPHEDPTYTQTKYFHSEQAAQEGWPGPIIPEIIQYLLDQGVTHVHDEELSYDFFATGEFGYFPIDQWAEIMMKMFK